MFRVWPEINRWEKENRDFLRVRARVGEAMARWVECNRQSDYLLAPGRPLAEAEDLLRNYESSLEPEERSYILVSRAIVARGLRRRRLIVAGVIAALTTVAGAAVWEWRAAVQSETRAVSARSSAEGILNYLLNQLNDKLKPIGHLDIIEDVQKQVETYYKNLGFSQEDPNALNNWATLLRSEGDRLQAQGDLNGAKSKFQQSLEAAEKVVKQAPADTTWQRNLSVIHGRLGLVEYLQGDLTGAKAHSQPALEIALKLATRDPSNSLWQHDLVASYNRLGTVLLAQGDLRGANSQFQSSLEIALKVANQDPSNSLWQRDLGLVYGKLGDLLKAQGDLNGAKAQFQRGL
ncbi:MAG: tetratricopeptide repeat protein [Chthoniobacterales bacterium]